MATLGVVLGMSHQRASTELMAIADPNLTEDLFELKPWLCGVYGQIENDQIIIEGVLSSQADTGRKEDGQERLNTILDGLWDQYASESLPPLSKGQGVEERMRDLADGHVAIQVRPTRLVVF
jgi:hypothetical protein